MGGHRGERGPAAAVQRQEDRSGGRKAQAQPRGLASALPLGQWLSNTLSFESPRRFTWKLTMYSVACPAGTGRGSVSWLSLYLRTARRPWSCLCRLGGTRQRRVRGRKCPPPGEREGVVQTFTGWGAILDEQPGPVFLFGNSAFQRRKRWWTLACSAIKHAGTYL